MFHNFLKEKHAMCYRHIIYYTLATFRVFGKSVRIAFFFFQFPLAAPGGREGRPGTPLDHENDAQSDARGPPNRSRHASTADFG